MLEGRRRPQVKSKNKSQNTIEVKLGKDRT
jgi:hypothetical protein